MVKQSLPKFQIYEKSDKGKKLQQVNSDNPILEDYNMNQPFFIADHNNPKIQKQSENPFLQNPNTQSVDVLSIEDFLIDVKGKKILFGDVINNPEYSLRTRKKITKRAFKEWRKEFQKHKKLTFKENEKVVSIIGEISFVKLNFKLKIFNLIIFLLILFLVTIDSNVWEIIKLSKFGNKIFIGLNSMYLKFGWLKQVGIITTYITLFLIFYNHFYSMMFRDFQKDYQLAKNFLNKSEGRITKDFNKKYNNARKYYLSKINNKKIPYFPPLSMDQVQEGQINISIFNDICKKTIDRGYRVKKTRPYVVGIRFILQWTTYIGSIILVGMSLFFIIINLFKT